MKVRILGLIASLFICTASAQTPAPGTVSPQPSCWPTASGGSGGAILSGGNLDGQWFGWWCSLPDFTIRLEGIISYYAWGWIHPLNYSRDMITMLTTPSIVDSSTLAEYWSLNVRVPSTLTTTQSELGAQMLNTMETIRPLRWYWTRVAMEGQTFEEPGVREYRYGAIYGSTGAWITMSITGPATCNNEFFGGDPMPGVVKVCQGIFPEGTEPSVLPIWYISPPSRLIVF